MSFSEHTDADARLRILQAMKGETDRRLSDRMLVNHLDAWGHRRSIDYVRTQLHKLKEVGAVTLPVERDTTVVGEITNAGLDHVDRRVVISGVRRPDPGE